MSTYANKTQENKSQSIADTVSRIQGEKRPLQFTDNRPEAIAQRNIQTAANAKQITQRKKENKTGLPDNLKTGIENLSGLSMNDVKVHYNSDKPALLQAHAYAQGTDIHIASGQEKHLPHEAWHVVQQKQGRVKPTMQRKGKVNVNDNKGLENEADLMGNKALHPTSLKVTTTYPNLIENPPMSQAKHPLQRVRMNQEDLIDIYHDDSDFNATIDRLDGVRTIEVDSLEFYNGQSWEPKNSSRGLTLPHEAPPVIFINHNNFKSQEEIASTLYHEVYHAYDRHTPAKNDDSKQAMKQDFINEANTQKIEAERALRRGDHTTVAALIQQGKLIETKEGPQLNLERFDKIAGGDYSNYASVSRSIRFDLNSYRYRALSKFKPGSWNAIIDKGYEADIDE